MMGLYLVAKVIKMDIINCVMLIIKSGYYNEQHVQNLASVFIIFTPI